MAFREEYPGSNAGIEVRLMQAADAAGVVELYKTVYGNDYPVKTVYDPAAIIEQQNNGEMYRIIARSGDKVVGQTALYRSTSPNPEIYEAGQGIVLPLYRNQGILEQCLDYGHEVAYPQLNIKQEWGEAVCNHTFTQKAGTRLGAFETGIELDLMPASSYVKEQSSQGRVAALLMFKIFQAAPPQLLYLPEAYADSLHYLYSVYDFGHKFVSSNSLLPEQATRGQVEIYADAAVARFTLLETGKDLENYLLEQERLAQAQGCSVFQAYLKLANPAVDQAVNLLRKHQYFLGGILPRWFATDGLLMQKLLHEPNLEGINLYSERAHKILNIIIDDRNTVLL